MTREEMLRWLEEIKKDIYVCPLESTFADDTKSCAIYEAIKALSAKPREDAISRQAAMVAIRNQYPGIPFVDVNGARRKWAEKYAQYRECEKIIESLPSVYPIRPRGEWKRKPQTVMGAGYMWFCNRCHDEVYEVFTRPYPSEKFCPNCGADMRGEGHE